MNLRKTCVLCVGGSTVLFIVWMSGLLLEAGHAGPATGVGSVYAANVQQEKEQYRHPLSLRTLARVLHDCDKRGKPIHPGLVRWASRGLSSAEGQKVSEDQLFGLVSFQSVSNISH
ncbi:MAG: hypothetical protein ABGW75_11370 [Pirellulales bacterium]|jgi:hypothetical protein